MVFGITDSLVQSMIPYLQELQPNNMIKSEKSIQGTTIGSAYNEKLENACNSRVIVVTELVVSGAITSIIMVSVVG